MNLMTLVEGVSMVVAGLAMVYFALPRKGNASWVIRFPFLCELYAVGAISLLAMGVCIVASS